MSENEKDQADELQFEVPTTEEDVRALRAVRRLGVPTFAEHIRWLSRQPVDHEALGKRKLPIGYEPFTLED